MAVTQIDLIKRMNGSGTNSRMYARSDGTGLWIPRDPLANPTFVDSSNPLKATQFDLSAMTGSGTNIIPFDNFGMADDGLSYQEMTVTATGLQDDFNISSGIGNATYLRCNNASLLTFGGFTNGRAGKWLVIRSIGAGAIDILNISGGSSGNNKISTGIATTIHLAAGSASYAILRYDQVTAQWMVLQWEQGVWLSYTPTWSATGTAPVLGNGTLSGSYYRKGNMYFVNVQLTLGSTSTTGTGAWHFSLPAAVSGRLIGGSIACTDAGTANYSATVLIQTSTSAGGVLSTGRVSGTAPFTWGTSDLFEMNLWFGT